MLSWLTLAFPLQVPITREEDFHNPNTVKVVTCSQGYALYFRRVPLPILTPSLVANTRRRMPRVMHDPFPLVNSNDARAAIALNALHVRQRGDNGALAWLVTVGCRVTVAWWICSRAGIPHGAFPAGGGGAQHALKHVGIYAFRRSFLAAFSGLPPSHLQALESLEQLKVRPPLQASSKLAWQIPRNVAGC